MTGLKMGPDHLETPAHAQMPSCVTRHAVSAHAAAAAPGPGEAKSEAPAARAAAQVARLSVR